MGAVVECAYSEVAIGIAKQSPRKRIFDLLPDSCTRQAGFHPAKVAIGGCVDPDVESASADTRPVDDRAIRNGIETGDGLIRVSIYQRV